MIFYETPYHSIRCYIVSCFNDYWRICFIPINFSSKHDTLSYRILIFAMSILIPKAPMGRGRADVYIIRRNCTLWFWLVRTSQTLWIAKNKATGTPHGVYCIQPSLASDGYTARCQEGELYTYTNVGLSALLVSTDMSNTNGMVRKWQEQTYEISSRVEARLVFFCISPRRTLFLVSMQPFS